MINELFLCTTGQAIVLAEPFPNAIRISLINNGAAAMAWPKKEDAVGRTTLHVKII